MNSKRTIIIAIIFLLLGGFYYFYEIKGKPQREEKKTKENAVFSIKEENVKSLTLTRNNQTFVFEKRDKTWYVKQPVEARADQDTLAALVKAVTGAGKTETIEEKPADLKQYNLDTPPYQVTISDGQNQETMLLGGQTIGNRSFYAKRKELEPVFLVDTGFKYSLDKNTADFRDRTVVDVPMQDIQKVVYHHRKNTFTFVRMGTVWTSADPQILRPSSEQISSFIGYLSTLKTAEFLENTPLKQKEYGIQNSDFRIEIFGKDPNRPVILRIGKADKRHLYASIDGAKELYALMPVEEKRLVKKPDDFTDRMIVKEPGPSIYTLTARIGGKEYVFKKEKVEVKKPPEKSALDINPAEGFKWKMVSPTTKDIDSTGFSMDVVTPLSSLYAVEVKPAVPDMKKFGLNPATAYYKAQAEDGKVLFELETGNNTPPAKGKQDLTYARLIGENYLFLVSKNVMDQVKATTLKEVGDQATAAPGASPVPASPTSAATASPAASPVATSAPAPVVTMPVPTGKAIRDIPTPAATPTKPTPKTGK